jgi:hypothetical protein
VIDQNDVDVVDSSMYLVDGSGLDILKYLKEQNSAAGLP